MRAARGTNRPGAVAHGSSGISDPQALKRRSEAFNLAFVLLGGRRAANGFLDSVHPGMIDVPRTRVGASDLGLIEVVRVLRRQALNATPSEIRP